MSAQPITSSAPSAFSPSSPPPVAPRKDDEDDAPSFRQVMNRASRAGAPRPRDARESTDRESLDADRSGARGTDRTDDAPHDDDHGTVQAQSAQAQGAQAQSAQAQSAQAQSAQQIAMQALALAGMTPPTQVASTAGANQQLDALSQLNALAGMTGGNGPGHGLGNGLGNNVLDARTPTAPATQPAPTAQTPPTVQATKPSVTAMAIDPRLAALLGAMQPTAATAAPTVDPAAAKTAQPAQNATAAADPALTAAIHRAISTLGGVASTATTPASPADAAAAATKAAAVLAAAGDSPSPTALTPLEQAVHDLIGQLGDQKHGKTKPDDSDPLAELTDDPTASQTALGQLAAQPASPHAVPGTTRASELDPTRPAALAQPPEAPSNPSHVHLVLDDGPDRVVVTVAVRGNDIHVALRGNDDATTNALARNAASLDHAMRARGLQLSQLTAEREPHQPDDAQRQSAEPREPKQPDKRFVLEENL